MITVTTTHNIPHFKWRVKGGQKRRKPQPAFWTGRQKFWFRSWNPAEQLASFQHLGCKIAADGKPGSELKVKPEKGWLFLSRGDITVYLHRRITELCLRDERYYLNWRLKNLRSSKCVSWLVLLQLCLIKVWIYRVLSWRYLGESKKH